MILNTIFFLGYFYLILFSIVGYGLAYSNFINLEYKSLDFGIIGIIGCFVCTTIALLTNLFFAHNFTHNLIVNLIGIIFFIFFFLKNIKLYKLQILILLILSLSFILLLFISKNNEDFPYYHLPFTINVIDSKIQFGTGHFNYSFRTPSSLFYLHSLFYLPGIKYYLQHISGLIILIFSNFFLLKNFIFKESNNRLNKFYSFLIFLFINLFFISLAKYGTDRHGHIIAFIIFIFFLDLINSNEYFLSKCKILVILILYLISIKSYFLPYFLLFFLLLYLIIINKKLIIFLKNIKFFICSLLFFSLYLFHNFAISSCFLPLLKSTCVNNLFWSTPSDTIDHYNKWYELWSKAGATPNYRVSDPIEYVQYLNWVPNWINNYFFTKGSDVLSGIIAICILFIIFAFFFKIKKNIKKANKYFVLYIFIIIFFLIWFFKHPDLRYGGYVLVASLFFIPLSSFFSKYDFKNKNKKFFIIIVITIIFSANIRNAIRIFNEYNRNDPFVYKNFPFFYIKNVEYETKLIQHKVKIHIVNEACWSTPSPCLSSNINVVKINGYNFFYPVVK
jgi:hypothetical protein